MAVTLHILLQPYYSIYEATIRPKVARGYAQLKCCPAYLPCHQQLPAFPNVTGSPWALPGAPSHRQRQPRLGRFRLAVPRASPWAAKSLQHLCRRRQECNRQASIAKLEGLYGVMWRYKWSTFRFPLQKKCGVYGRIQSLRGTAIRDLLKVSVGTPHTSGYSSRLYQVQK